MSLSLNRSLTRRLSRSLIAMTLAVSVTACGGFSLRNNSDKKKEIVSGERVSVLSLEDELTVDASAGAIDIRLPSTSSVSEWAQPGGNTTNSLGHLALGSNLKTEWRSKIGKGTTRASRLTSSPVYADGRIFALDARAQVSAVDASNGKRVWKVSVAPEKETPTDGAGGGLAHDIGRIFVATGFGEVLALDAETGEEIWRRSMIVPFHAAPTVSNGRVYISSVNNQLHALSAFDGTSLWSHRSLVENEGMFTDTNSALIDDLVIAPFSSGEVTALRVQNGRQAWSDALTRTGRMNALSDMKMIAARPVVDRGQVIAVSHSGRIVAIDIRSGERIWSRNVASIQTPWVAGNVIYVISMEGQIMALSRRDGRVLWLTQMKNKSDSRGRKPILWTGPLLAGNQLIALSTHGRLAVLSPFTGAVISEQKIGQGVYVSPMIVGETLYFLNDDGVLVAMRGTGSATVEAMTGAKPEGTDDKGVAQPKEKREGFFRRLF